MLGFPTVRELGNPLWEVECPFSTWKDFRGIFTGLWFVLLFVLFFFEFLLFYGNPKIFLENFSDFFSKIAFNTFPGYTKYFLIMLLITIFDGKEKKFCVFQNPSLECSSLRNWTFFQLSKWCFFYIPKK